MARHAFLRRRSFGLLLLGSLAFLTGVQLVCTGLIGEILIRIYFESQNRRIYSVARVISHQKK